MNTNINTIRLFLPCTITRANATSRKLRLIINTRVMYDWVHVNESQDIISSVWNMFSHKGSWGVEMISGLDLNDMGKSRRFFEKNGWVGNQAFSTCAPYELYSGPASNRRLILTWIEDG